MKVSEEFSEMVAKLTAPVLNMNFLHGAVGVSTEAGELLDLAKKHMAYNQTIQLDHVVEELGDILFYMEMVRAAFDLSWEEVERRNIDKLATRYPEGEFSPYDARKRADKASVLSKGATAHLPPYK